MQQQLTHAQTAAKTQPAHHLILEERNKLTITGVLKVHSCDEYGALLETPVGRLQIVGQGIAVSELSLETGEVRFSGELTELSYLTSKDSTGGFLRRFFR